MLKYLLVDSVSLNKTRVQATLRLPDACDLPGNNTHTIAAETVHNKTTVF